MTTFQHLEPYYDNRTYGQPIFSQYYSTQYKGLQVAVNPSNLVETTRVRS